MKPDAVSTAKAFPLRVMAPLLLGCVLNPINSSMIATALVPIGESLHEPASRTAWLVAALYLASAIGQPGFGALADRFGPRRIFLIGLGLVALGGLLGALTTSFAELIAARVVLGFGTSAAYPSAMTLVRRRADSHGIDVPGSVLANISVTALATVAIGPTLGGFLQSAFGWRSIFFVNLPLALVGAILTWIGIAREPPAPLGKPADAPFDALGLALFGLTLAALLLFLMGPQKSWYFLPIAVAIAVPFAIREWRLPAPFLDLRMLRDNGPLRRTYLRSIAIYFVVYAIFYGYAPWEQKVRGMTASQAGLVMIPMTIAAAVSSVFASRRKTPYFPMVLGAVLLLGGAIALFFVDSKSPLVFVVAISLVFGLPQGLSSMSHQMALYVQAPTRSMGAASGLLRTAIYLGAMTSSCAIAAIYGATITDASLHILAIVLVVVAAPLVLVTALETGLRKV